MKHIVAYTSIPWQSHKYGACSIQYCQQIKKKVKNSTQWIIIAAYYSIYRGYVNTPMLAADFSLIITNP